jgi:hypothetical protein
MRIRLLCVFLISIITLNGISSGAVTVEHTADEWKSILAVPPDSGTLTGLQVVLTIDPNQYYHSLGSSVNISGSVFNIFGPVDNASLIFTKGEGETPVPCENLTSNEEGKFSIVSMINSSGTIRYQVWLEDFDDKKPIRISSNEIEIYGAGRGIENDTAYSKNPGQSPIPGFSAWAETGKTGDTDENRDSDLLPVVISGEVTGNYGPEPGAKVIISLIDIPGEDQIGYRVTGLDGLFEFRDMKLRSAFPVSFHLVSDMGTPDPFDDLETNVTAVLPASTDDNSEPDVYNDDNLHETESDQPAFPGITLKTDTGSFAPGQNVTFSGNVWGIKGDPRSFTGVALERSDAGSFVKIGESLSTDRNGSYSVSYHLTGPYSPDFRSVSTDENGNTIVSGNVSLSFLPERFFPIVRNRMDSRHIDAILSSSVIRPGENITISGWFADGNGDVIRAGMLYLYWYNFADRIWDRYEPSTKAITSGDGQYSFNVSGPNATGISYFAVISKREQSGNPLFSPSLLLTVRTDSKATTSVIPTVLTGKSNPAEVTVHSQAEINFTLSDISGVPLAEEPLRLYFSEDGFTWYMNGNGNLTTNAEGIISMTDSPKRAGFHYYQGIYNGSALYGPADSGILIIPVVESLSVFQNSMENATSGSPPSGFVNI